MGDYKRLALLVLVMIGVAVVVGATAIGMIYDAAFDRERERLVNIAQSQARLMEALAHLDAPAGTTGAGAVASALPGILEAHRRLREQVIGRTAELQLARLDGEAIVYLTPERESARPHELVPFGGALAQPMTAALSGRSGTMIGRDYAGRRVLAAFEPITGLGLGLVAKIDMREINAQYLRAGSMAGVVAVIAVLMGALLFFQIGEPMVRRVRVSEQRYRDLVEGQPDPICRFLPDTTLTFVNRAYADFYGRAPEDLVGRRWLDFAPLIERPRFLDQLTSMSPEHPARLEETLTTTVGGEKRWLLCHLHAFFDKAGEATSFQSFGTDISERKRAEEAVRQGERRYRMLVEAQPDPICQFQPDTTLTFVNRAYADFYGTEPEALLGKRWLDFAAADERPRFLEELSSFTPANPERHEETRSTRADREVRWYLCHLHAFFDGQGNTLSFQTFGTDITARKRAEEQLARQVALLTAITDSAADAIFVTGADGCVTLINPAAERMFGWSRDELKGRNLHEAIHGLRPGGSLYTAAECPLGRVYATGEILLGHEDVFFRKDGSPVEVACSNAPLVIAGGIAGAVLLAHDIGERKRTEAALRESEARLRRTVDYAPFPIIVHAENGEVVHISEAWLQLSGYRREEIGSIAAWTERAYGIRKDTMRAEIDQLYAADQAVDQGEKAIRVADGRVRVWSFRSAPLGLDERGRRLVVTMAADVTEHREVERNLRESELRMRALLDASQDEILLMSTRGEILAINKAAQQRLAKRTAGANPVGARLDRLLPPDQADARMAIVRKVAATATLVHCDTPIRSRWFEFWFYPVLEGARPVSEVAVYAREITQQKKSQADLGKLFQAIQQSPMSVVITDRNGAIEYVNPGFTKVTGYTLAEAVGRNPRLLKSGYTAPELYVEMWRTITAGDVWRGELQNKKKSGELYWELASIAPVTDGERITNFVAVKEDITARRQMEEQLRQSQKMHAIGQLTGGIAHDFNNLLAIVIGNLQLIEERFGGDAKARECLEDALWSAKRGAELTHRLLAFARKQPLKPTVVDLNEVVRGITEILRRTLGLGIHIEERLSPDLWKALADRGELERALVNLAVNSRDAMQGGGALSLETRNVLIDADYAEQYEEVTPGDYVLLAVSDTGTGMTAEVAEHVFEPFFTTKEVGQGSGLGLSMVYGFVKQSGGHISIYSRIGEGTSVKLYLPRATTSPLERDAGAAETFPKTLGRKVVLVVEDEPKLRKVAVKMLDRLGLRSLQAETAQAALDFLAETPVDLLFTDIELPGGMNGIELADAARRSYPGLEVLFTTGYARETTLQNRSLHARARCLLKPYALQELARELKALLAPEVH